MPKVGDCMRTVSTFNYEFGKGNLPDPWKQKFYRLVSALLQKIEVDYLAEGSDASDAETTISAGAEELLAEFKAVA